MALYLSNLLDNLEDLCGKEFETVYRKKKFTVLFYDSTKLRLRLEHRDISIPFTVLLLGITRLFTHKSYDKNICVHILGKDWGFGYVARLLLECDDIILDPKEREMRLVRLSKYDKHQGTVSRPEYATVAVNPNGNGHS